MRSTNLDSLGFKYRIGDVLIHKGINHVKMPKEDEPRFSSALTALNCVRFIVTGRVAEECPGGVQLKYVVTVCQGHTGDVSASPIRFLEEELIPLPDGG